MLRICIVEETFFQAIHLLGQYLIQGLEVMICGDQHFLALHVLRTNPEIGTAAANKYKLPQNTNTNCSATASKETKYWVNPLFGLTAPLLCLWSGRPKMDEIQLNHLYIVLCSI